jgi:hypothetical protein
MEKNKLNKRLLIIEVFPVFIFLIIFIVLIIKAGPDIALIFYPFFAKVVFFLLTPFFCILSLYSDFLIPPGFSLWPLFILPLTFILNLVYLWCLGKIIYHLVKQSIKKYGYKSPKLS